MINYTKIYVLTISVLLFSSVFIPSIFSGRIKNQDDVPCGSVVFLPEEPISNRVKVKINSSTVQTVDLYKCKMMGNQSHPSISSNNNGSHLISYFNDADNNTYFGTIGGDMRTWDLIGTDYPSIKHWNDTQFYATVTAINSTYGSGSYFIFDIPNPSNMNTWVGNVFSWPNQYGWYNNSDCEIVCDSSLEDWNFGFISLIASNEDYNIIDAPHVLYCYQEDNHVLSWVNGANHSEHIDACIDKITKKAYSVTDRIENDSWQLFLDVRDFTNEMDILGNYDIVGSGNLTNPKVSAYNDDMIIVAETDQNGNKDIVCFFNTPNDPQQVLIANSDADERFPEIERIDDTTYICSFISENTLYYSFSSNGGQTWSNPIKIKEHVIEAYKSIDLSENLDYMGCEVINGSDSDVEFDDLRQSIVFVDDDYDNSTPGWQYDHFDVIQDGIDAVAEGGTIYVFNGTYYENVVVNKTIDLIGENSYNTIIDGKEIDQAIRISEDFVNISSFTIKNTSLPHSGIYINSNNTSIVNNIITSNAIAMKMVTTNNCTFTSNVLFNNYLQDISIQESNSNSFKNNLMNNLLTYQCSQITIDNNTFLDNSNSYKGIDIRYSLDCIINNNSFLTDGIAIDGNNRLHWTSQTIENNYVNSSPIYFIKNANGGIVPSDAGQVILADCTYMTIQGLNLTNLGLAIQLGYSDNNNIINNSLSNNYGGIVLKWSLENLISDNKLSQNDGFGYYSSYAHSNTISNNFVNDGEEGIYLHQSDYNDINNNTISAFQVRAIKIYFSCNNEIFNNDINNNYLGVNIDLSSIDNSIYHNNFFNNFIHAYDTVSNSWDNGNLSGGNYWDDYTGTDTDGDGTGDTPYNISGGNNKDLYPLGYFHPIANFTYSPSNPIMLSRVYFNDTSFDPDGNITSWFWDFGEGDTSTEQHPSNIFVNEGNYTVCLTVTDNDGKNNTYCQTIHVETGLDVNQTLFDRGFPIRHAVDGDWAAAQSFTPIIDMLTRVEIILRKFGTPEFNLTVELRTDDPQGSLIDSRTYMPDQVSSSWEMFEVNFNDTTVQNDTDYFIVIPPVPSGVATSFGYEWGYAFDNQYDDGSFWFTRDGGGLWRDLPAMYEFAFRTFGYNL